MFRYSYPTTTTTQHEDNVMHRGHSPPYNTYVTDSQAILGPWQKRFKETKSTCIEMKYFFSQRAALEEEFAQKLRNLARLSLGTNEEGNVKLCVNAVKKELETTAKAHELLATRIRDDLETPSQKQYDQLRTTKKNVMNNLISKQQSHSNNLFMLDRTRERCHEASQREGRQIIDQDLHRLSIQFEESSRELDGEINRTAEGFRQLEISRVQFFRNTLWKYANLLSGVCVTDDEGQERIRSALEKCDAKTETEYFAKDPAINNIINSVPHLEEKSLSCTVIGRSSPLRNEIRKPIEQRFSSHHPNENQGLNKLMSSELVNATIARSPILAAQRSFGSGRSNGRAVASANSSPATTALVRNMSIAYSPQSNTRMNSISPPKENSFPRPSPQYPPTTSAYPQVPLPQPRPTTFPTQPPPPPESEERPVLFHVKAVYDYDAEIPEEISFREGQMISVLATQLDGWWEGQIRENNTIRQGIFPSNFTEPVTL